MTYDAGAARAIYSLAIDGFESSIQRAKQLYAELQAAQQQAARPQSLPGVSTPGGASSSRAASFAQEARAVAGLEAQQARLARVQGDAARAAEIEASAQQRLTAALVRTDTTTSQAIGLQRQLASVQAQAARSSQQATQETQQLGGALGGLGRGLGGLGIAFGVQQIVSFGTEAGRAGLALDRTERLTRELTGSQARYNAVVEAARQQQLLFGGSLQSNIDDLSGFAVQARLSGASLQSLITTAQRLAVLDPEQGIRGASVAIREALSGDPVSLARRFEIPRTELAKLRDESTTAADKLKVISDFLDKAGVSADALGNATSGTQRTYNQLGASLDDAKTRFGSFLAQGLEPAARGLDRLTRLALGSRDAVIEFRQSLIGEDAGTARQNTIANEIDAAISRAAAARGQATGGEAFSDPATGIIVQTTEATDASQQLLAVLTPLRQRMIEVSVASDASAASVQNAVSQLVAGTITGPQFASVLDAIATRQRDSGDAADRHAQGLSGVNQGASKAALALQEFNANLQQNAVNAEISAAQSAILKARQEDIQRSAKLAAQGMLGAGDQALLMAKKYNLAADQAQLLIAQQQRLDAAQALADQRAGERSGGAVRTEAEQKALTKARQLNADFERGQAEKQKQIQQAQNALDLTRARTSAQRIAILQREQAQTADVAERIRLQAQIEQERNSGAKAHTQELSKQLGLEEKIRDSKEQQLQASIDARKLAAQDVLDRLKEDQQLAQARRVLASSHDERFRQAAQARIDLIGAERDSRALALQQAQATAGGAIVGGRVFQSIPGGGAGQPIPALPAAGGVAAGAPGAAVAGGRALTINLVADGHQLAQVVIPDIMAALLGGQLQNASAGGVR